VARTRLDPGNLCELSKGCFATTFLSSSPTCPARQSGSLCARPEGSRAAHARTVCFFFTSPWQSKTGLRRIEWRADSQSRCLRGGLGEVGRHRGSPVSAIASRSPWRVGQIARRRSPSARHASFLSCRIPHPHQIFTHHQTKLITLRFRSLLAPALQQLNNSACDLHGGCVSEGD
jgi:hypothetical protein